MGIASRMIAAGAATTAPAANSRPITLRGLAPDQVRLCDSMLQCRQPTNGYGVVPATLTHGHSPGVCSFPASVTGATRLLAEKEYGWIRINLARRAR